MILREKGAGGGRPSCPLIFWLLKKATRTFNFLRMFLLVKDIRNFQISLPNELLLGVYLIVSAYFFILKAKFFPNFLRMTPESQMP